MPARHGSGQAKGIADGVHLLADLQVARIAENRGREIGRLDLNDGKIMCRVAANHGRAKLLAVVHGYFDLARVGDHVVVGEDVALFINDETRALAFLRYQPVEEIEGRLLST